LWTGTHTVIIQYMINPPMYSKPARPNIPTKTQLRKELAALKRDIKKGLNGPDADIYRMMSEALKGLDIR
jgi:hypothetical protein